ncbi:protein-disulfide reductase DsbD family protein [Mangrovivirga sp. M17]|uniref:Protein-disulfide reductase DsbD family protein n=1 Tax=Mangrovivirga halotolerans TaxID=2993936 RepID=A0ABT3RNQ6_9BACT|nr:protein-disulfide reductase DsbD domain-containing protein [Mangrovivirga halotolerans]MCX2742795.1 protein-disulfide reductase DsbD family protein [Mangrovivirga halotolerans]
MSFFRKTSLLVILLVITCSNFQDNDWVHFQKFILTPTENPDTLVLYFTIDQGFHIQSDQPEDDLMIPTELYLQETNTLSFGRPIFPEPEYFYVGNFKTQVFSNELIVKVPLIHSGKLNQNSIFGTIKYQPCNSQKCFFPRELSFKINL